jgi:uncharacterized membrane protein YfhO
MCTHADEFVEGTRVLVLSEMYFPGWRAFIDGAEAPIYCANYLFRAVQVPRGHHEVAFVYRPMSAVVGAVLSILSVLLALWTIGAPRRRR